MELKEAKMEALNLCTVGSWEDFVPATGSGNLIQTSISALSDRLINNVSEEKKEKPLQLYFTLAKFSLQTGVSIDGKNHCYF